MFTASSPSRIRDLTPLLESIMFWLRSAPVKVQFTPLRAQQPLSLNDFQILLPPTCSSSPSFYYGKCSKSLLQKVSTEGDPQQQHRIRSAQAGPDSPVRTSSMGKSAASNACKTQGLPARCRMGSSVATGVGWQTQSRALECLSLHTCYLLNLALKLE